ncbi:MAG TPA: hypothetical protein PKD09_16420 [Aggregatilinea sp.]|jgi:hypothetical protein|uniref:hypothetical protein n=1 Tax=Aggregatilinea sp. TaxID=2806333 RepID=UPI002BA17189|nr:hypothetical protein [Aggregatilinea sp.]HML23241.1 hypothetical protein [Aggregatilinea sp.]
MDLNLHLLNNPNLRPRDEVRIDRVEAVPFPDGRRVHVEVEVTPFRERPNLEITMRNEQGRNVGEASVIATMTFKMEFNLHLRGITDPAGHYAVEVALYYDDPHAPQDQRRVEFTIPSSPENA